VLRRIKRQQIVALDVVADIECVSDDSLQSPERQAESRLDYQRVLAIIAGLPERCRQVVELRKLQGWSQKEIAAHLGITEKAVEKQIWTGVRAVRQAWQQTEAEVDARQQHPILGRGLHRGADSANGLRRLDGNGRGNAADLAR
jgi:RNA polymerase sigma-70 factor (ECF subfamily)